MSDSPFFQFYPSDWLAGTRGLTAAETGVYITLVAMMYEAEGPVPNDPKRLARLCGSTPATFSKIVGGLLDTGKITEDERGFSNRRVEIEIKKRAEKRSAASASANARWQKTVENQQTENANASSPQCERNANQKPDTREEEDIPPSAGETPPIRPVEVDPVNKATWDLGIKLLAPSGDKAAVKSARSNIGRWLKGRKPLDVLAALSAAQQAGTHDPLPYVEATLKNGGATRPGKTSNPDRWIDPATGRGVEQFHPHAVCMGNGWWCRPGEEVEWYKNTNELRPDKRTRERQDAEVRSALSGCI